MNGETSGAAVSEPMRQVLEAAIANQPIPIEARAALSPAERDEVDALLGTMRLTQAVLQQPEPSAEAEARSLQRSQKQVAARAAAPTPFSWLTRWWRRKG